MRSVLSIQSSLQQRDYVVRFRAFPRNVLRSPNCSASGWSHRCARRKVLAVALQPVNTFLVPDISGDAHTSPAVLKAARAAAAGLTTGELLIRTSAEIAGAWALCWIVNAVVLHLSKKARQNTRENIAEGGDIADLADKRVSSLVLEAGVAAVAQPAKYIVPFTALAHTLRILSLSLQIFLEVDHFKMNVPKTMMHMASGCFMALQRLDQTFLSLSQISIVIFIIWFLIGWKENLVDIVVRLEKRKRDLGEPGGNLERILLPVSSLAGWGLVTVGGLMVLHVLGLNIGPLLALGGFGTVALGIGAQSITSNAISGLNLFLTRPFIVGERVELKTTGGGSVLVGLVERIDVMRTLIRTDKGIPVAVPNSSITGMIVSNESRLGKSPYAASFKDPRQYTTAIGIRYEDLDKVKAITADIKAFLDQHPGVDKKLPYGAGLGSLQDWSVQIGLMVHTTPAQSSNYGAFTTEVMWKLVEIVEKHGAQFAFPTQINIHQNANPAPRPA